MEIADKREPESWWPHKPWPIAALLVIVVLTLGQLLPKWRAQYIRSHIKVGSLMEDVLGREGHWLFCRVYAGPREKRTVYWEAWPTSYGHPHSPPIRTFQTREEMSRALAAELRATQTSWRVTFVYHTDSQQFLFDVDFSAGGRVTAVSEARTGMDTLE